MEQRKEFIYILYNSDERLSGIIKVGKTTKHPEVRAYQITSQTGTFGQFHVEWFMQVPDCNIAEKIAHNKLNDFRSNSRKEFFEIDIDKAINILETSLNQYFETELPTYRSSNHENKNEKQNLSFTIKNLHVWWKQLPNIIR